MGWRNSELVAQNDGDPDSKHFIMPVLKSLILLGGDFTLVVSFFIANLVIAEMRLKATMKYSNKVNFTFLLARFCSWNRRGWVGNRKSEFNVLNIYFQQKASVFFPSTFKLENIRHVKLQRTASVEYIFCLHCRL